MLKRDVVIGQSYVAKITNRMTVVKILGENRFGGWDARNVETGRLCRIKSAQKLRRVA